MQIHFDNRILRHVAAGSGTTVLDVAGLTVEFLTGPQDTAHEFCVMRGIIPPGAVVPIHSHDSTETFLVLSGTKQALIQGEHGMEWIDVHEGDYVQIGSGEAHALRNASSEPVVELIITNARLGDWFKEGDGRPTAIHGHRLWMIWPAFSWYPPSTATGSAHPRRTGQPG